MTKRPVQAAPETSPKSNLKRHSIPDQYRKAYLEALPEAAKGDRIAIDTVTGIEALAEFAEKNRRKHFPFLPEKRGEGCIASLNWVEMVDALSDQELDRLREEYERSLRPKPKNYSPAPRPTLDDFDNLGAIWGNA